MALAKEDKYINGEGIKQLWNKIKSMFAKKTDIDSLLTSKGQPNGLATLDDTGKVPSSQLPSYVDDVLEYDNKSVFPGTGEAGKIYVSKNDNKTYRWSGSAYVEISASLALGETTSTAYEQMGDKAPIDNPNFSRDVRVQGTVYVNGQNREEVATKNDLNNYLPKTGGIMTGDITFQSIVVGESSKGLKWDGATDGASIKYVVEGDDAGRLVIEGTDDSNARVIIRNNNQGTFHDTIFEDGTVTIDEKLVITNKTTTDRELIKLADDIDLVDYQDCRLGIKCNTANDFGIHFKGDAGRDATYMFPSSGGTMATEEYVSGKMPTFSFSNGVLTITTH